MTKYVELKTAIDAVNDVYYDTPDINLSADKLEAALLGLPSADVVPVVHGRWQGTADGYADGELVYDMWECSVCGFDADGAEEKPCWDFCPNCGARMDGDSNAVD